ncbi:transglycosylase SLT domain-containing protein [Litorivicinus lipolyticus]|uniref:lytic transglycosylase domain-containing protein n=1 Tax=Litorivicinus lipolyticus TaxID=418701 RepID=UPI003B5CCE56
MLRHLRASLIYLSLWVGAPPAFASDALIQQRQTFAQAWQALERDQPWEALASSIQEYRLYPELEIEAARRHDTVPALAQAEAFLAGVSQHHSQQRLRAHWVERAVASQRWTDAIALAPRSADVATQCRLEQARLALGRGSQSKALALYRHPRSRPVACDDLFDTMRERGWISAWVMRQRLDLALDAGQIGLARSLAAELGPLNQARVENWHRARTQPDDYLRAGGEFMTVAAQALAKRDPDALEAIWPRLSLDPKVTTEVKELQALHAILDGSDRAEGYLQALNRPYQTAGLDEWSVRYYLTRNQPAQVLREIERLPSARQASPRWQYWRGWALQQSGQETPALEHYRAAARSNSYYGFLAADALGLSYAHPTSPIKPRANRSLTVGQQIARELWLAGLVGRARLQWRADWRALNRDQRSDATELARRWGWDSEVIRGAVNTGLRGLTYTHPASLGGLINEHAVPGGVDTAWALALTRSESLFQSDVQSGAGALGLMQIMPTTGRNLARQLKTQWRGSAMLLEPAVNVQFGVHYLNALLERFAGNQLMTTAAYNAGPNAVERWRPSGGSIDGARWAETIPYKETRGYVQKVMHAAVLYDYRLSGRSARLSDRMQPVFAATSP